MVLSQMSSKVQSNLTQDQFPTAGPIAILPAGLNVNYLVPVYVPAIALQSGGTGTTQQPGATTTTMSGQNAGTTASLDEAGYMTIAALCDTAEMTMFVRRTIAEIGCQ